MKQLNPKRTVIFALLLILSSSITACRLKVPIKKMTLAKATIRRANEVKAEQHAPKHLKTAKDSLYKSHAALKEKDIDKATDLANISLAEATKAVNKSLPPLSRSTLDEAIKIHKEAELLDAENYAPEEFKKAALLLEESEKLHSDGNYWTSYQNAKKLIIQATSERDQSITHVPEVEQEIEKLKNDVEGLKGKRGNDFASGEITAINSKLDGASEDVKKKNLKDANAKIKEIKTLLGEASQKTMKGMTEEKLKIAENSIAAVNADKVPENLKADYDNAGNLVKEGKSAYEQKSYVDAIAKLDQAIELLKTVNTTIRQQAEEKLEAAENTIAKLEESKFKDEFTSEIEKAKPLIAESRKNFDKAAYQESIAKSDEALTILNAAIIAMEKKSEEKRLSGDTTVSGEYVVKYNPKKRDCLWRIAHMVYKDARLWPRIYMANKDKIKDPDLIFPGQKFVIPSLTKKPEEEGEKKEEKTEDTETEEDEEKKEDSDTSE